MKTLLLFLAVLTFNTYAQSKLSASDIPAVIETYKANQARFGMNYKGRTMEDEFEVTGIREEIFEEGVYYVEMNALGKTVLCKNISNPQTKALLPKINKGMRLTTVGKIRDVAYGMHYLDGCTLRIIK